MLCFHQLQLLLHATQILLTLKASIANSTSSEIGAMEQQALGVLGQNGARGLPLANPKVSIGVRSQALPRRAKRLTLSALGAELRNVQETISEPSQTSPLAA